MSGMIFGEIPNFSEVLQGIAHLEHELNIASALSTV